MILHVVLFTYRPKISETLRKRALKHHQALRVDCGGQAAGILFWKVEFNLDFRKNVEIVQFSIFKDSDALHKFRNHKKHKEFTDIMREISDWQAGDIGLEDRDIPSLIKLCADNWQR